LAGIKFRRQSPVGIYIADFHCRELNLVIELDGQGHVEPGSPPEAVLMALTADGAKQSTLPERYPLKCPPEPGRVAGNRKGVPRGRGAPVILKND
jgi:hypothetical protein